MKQCRAWERAGVHVTTRPLRYPFNWPAEKAIEKGIDVLIAVDMVAMAIDNAYDAAVLASTDTDLIPALEFVGRHLKPAKTVEVAAWYSTVAQNRLRVTGLNIWCHRLDELQYRTIADSTDYNL